MQTELRNALERIYRGQANVAKEAEGLRMTTSDLKQEFRRYARDKHLPSDGWEDYGAPSWPFQ